MLLRTVVLSFLAMQFVGTSSADVDDKGLVRLPGQGELKEGSNRLEGSERLVPGGGLLLSFDEDQNGKITQEEIQRGIEAAFSLADSNEDRRITPLEQVKWIETLPTRDESLANPARFDPNLDRSVRMFEFKEIILALASEFSDASTGTIAINSLMADKPNSPEDTE